MAVDRLFSRTIELLGRSIDLRAQNHNHIAGNLANAETPGYTPKVLQFEEQLKSAMRQDTVRGPSTTHSRHIPLRGGETALDQVQGLVLEDPKAVTGRDGNSVELDAEMSRMVENQIMYNASVQIIAKKFEGLRYAIKGGQ